ncbi:hypothetical protein ACTXKB_13040 [Psychrobacter aquimaris]|uniref:hypothetical protein n=1 Tax=Psychrobacter aquimaris TaxID=292733 RepID=UPI003FD3CC9B
MTNITNIPQIIDELIEVIQNGGGLIDWVQADRFEQLTGIKQSSLRGKHEMWPEGEVWAKFDDGRLYYSIAGYNHWASQQAANRCRPVLQTETVQSVSGGCGTKIGSGKRLKNSQRQNGDTPPRLLSEIA